MKNNSPEKSEAEKFIDAKEQEFARVVRAEHSDPFAVLGPHWIKTEDGVRSLAIRVYRPGASGVSIVWKENGAVYPARQIDPGGLFEAILPNGVSQPPEGQAIDPQSYRQIGRAHV